MAEKSRPIREYHGAFDDLTQRAFDAIYEWARQIRLPSSTGSAVVNNTTINAIQEIFILDRFIGGAESVATAANNRDANIGELKWNTFIDAGGSVTRRPSEAGHMGVVRLTSAAGAGRASIYLGHASTAGNMALMSEIDETTWIVKFVQQRVRYGFGNDAAGIGIGTEAFYVQAETAVQPNWIVETRFGGAGTTFQTTVPVVANAWIEWRIKSISATELQFFANGVLVHTVVPPALMPAAGTLMGPVAQAIQSTGAAIGEIDTFSMILKAA